MSRQGRDFELLIKKLEEILLPEKAVITSPDFIKDKITGRQREVDISIRMDVGTVPILIIIECRDRQGDVDTTWIEQLHTKTCDLNANKVIAVSSSGFSCNAITKGNHYGIETRTYGEITHDDIKGWFKIEHMVLHSQNYLIHHVELNIGDISSLKVNPLEGKTVSDNFIIRTRDNEKVNLKSIFEGEAQAHNIWATIPIDNNLHRKTIAINFINPEDRYQIEDNGNVYPIENIQFTVDLKIEIKNIPISKITSYDGQEGPIAQTIEFDGALPNANQVLQFIKAKDGSILLSARKKDNE